MRKKKNIATGIDIGSETIKIAQIIRDGKSFALSNWLIIKKKELFKEGVLTQQPPEFLSRIIKAELHKSKLLVRNPAIATSVDDILFKYFFIPKSVKKRIVALLRLIATPHIASDIVFGFCRIHGISRIEKNELVMVGLIRNEILEFMYKVHEKLGEAVSHSVPRALAMYNLITFMKGGEEGQLYFCADISSGGLDMAIAAKTDVNRPINRMAFFRSVRVKEPEDNQGDAMLRVIYDEIQQTIMACQRELKLPEVNISQFWITGEKCHVEGLTGYLGNRLGKEVKLLDPVAMIGLKIKNGKSTGKMDTNPTELAASIGLALGMLNKLPVYIKLVPRLTEVKKKSKRNLKFLKVAISIALVTAFMIVYRDYYLAKIYRGNVIKAESTLSQFIYNESRLYGIAEGQKRLGEKLKKLKDISDRDFSEAALINLLDIESPREVTLKSVDIITVGGFQSLGSARWVRLFGMVKEAGNSASPLDILKNYVMNLEVADGFKNVQFKEIKESGDQSVSFQIEFMVD